MTYKVVCQKMEGGKWGRRREYTVDARNSNEADLFAIAKAKAEFGEGYWGVDSRTRIA